MSIQQLLVRGLARDSLALHETFQGLPGMAHGGSVLAAFDAIASQRGCTAPREIVGAYRRKVPLNTPLPLEVRPLGTGVAFHLLDGKQLLVEGAVTAPVPTAGTGSVEPASLPKDLRGGFPLPISDHCFACGIQNPLGLQVALRFDERRVWAEYLPREPLRTDDGRLSTAALITLLDETAFWLGALATGESGMTTELRVTLHRASPRFGESLIVVGERERVVPRVNDPRYQEAETVVFSAAGARLATGRITFVAMRGTAKRLIAGMLGVNPPDILRRVFPVHAG